VTLGIPEAKAEIYASQCADEDVTMSVLLPLERNDIVSLLKSMNLGTVGHRMLIATHIKSTSSVPTIPTRPTPPLSPRVLSSSLPRLSEYTLGALIGKGGFGKVYEATNSEGGKVALKKFKEKSFDGDQTRTIKMAKDEMRNTLQFSHENIVPLLDFYFEDDLPVLVMPRYPKSLKSYLQSVTEKYQTNMILSPGLILKFVKQIAEGLAHLHNRNFAHRDLKGENALIELDVEGQVTRILLSDFGTTRVLSDNTFWTQTPLWSPGFTAPEVVPGNGHDPIQADVYSLGCMIFEMLTGRPRLRNNKGTYPTLPALDQNHQSMTSAMITLTSIYDGCVKQDPDERLTVAQILDMLQINKRVLYSWGHKSSTLGKEPILKSSPGVVAVEDTTQIVAALTFCMMLTASRKVFIWGKDSNNIGFLGLGEKEKEVVLPREIPQLQYVIHIAARDVHCLAVVSENGKNQVYSWGHNYYGQLGVGDKNNRFSPCLVAMAENVTQVSAGYFHSMALTNHGRVYLWGNNSYGQLGMKNVTETLTPVCHPTLQDVTNIQSGRTHNLALTKSNTVYGWGTVGRAENVGRTTPYLIPNLPNIAHIACGWYTVGVVTSDGCALVADSNQYSFEPIFQDCGSVTQLSLGWNHMIAVTTKGDLFIFGDNASGTKYAPKKIDNLSNIRCISAGYYISLATSDTI